KAESSSMRVLDLHRRVEDDGVLACGSLRFFPFSIRRIDVLVQSFYRFIGSCSCRCDDLTDALACCKHDNANSSVIVHCWSTAGEVCNFIQVPRSEERRVGKECRYE